MSSSKEEKVERKKSIPSPDTKEEIKSYVVSSQDFVIYSRYTPIRKLGSGSYGIVCSAKDAKTGSKVAIKKITGVFENLLSARRTLREAKLLQHLKHPNIIGLVDLMQPADSLDKFEDLYIVLEYMQSDLQSILYKTDNELSENHIAFVVYQILCGLKYMHSANVVHRDLKPGNILINSDCRVKICDFGLAREITPARSRSGPLPTESIDSFAKTEYVVSRWYRAPEVMLSPGDYEFSIDVWSVGCILAELMGREPLFPGENYIGQLESIFRVIGTPSEDDMESIRDKRAKKFIQNLGERRPKSFRKMFPKFSDNCIDLLSKLLIFDPTKRISVDEALMHPFFSKYYNEEFVTKHSVCSTPFDPGFEKLTRTKKDLQHLIMSEVHKFRPIFSLSRPLSISDSADADEPKKGALELKRFASAD